MFCGKRATPVTEPVHKSLVTATLERYGVRPDMRGTCSRLSDVNLSHLRNNPHVAVPRSAGLRCMLVLTRLEDGTNAAVFVTQRQSYFVKYWFEDSLFDGTIFDGEVVQLGTLGKWEYVIQDAYACRGRSLSNLNIVRRLDAVHDALRRHWTPDSYDACNLTVARVFRYDECEALIEFIKSLPYGVRGILFKPLFVRFRTIYYEFDKGLPPLLSEPDVLSELRAEKHHDEGGEREDDLPEDGDLRVLRVVKTDMPDVYDLEDDATGSPRGRAAVPGMATSALLKQAMSDRARARMTCRWSSRFGKWIPQALER